MGIGSLGFAEMAIIFVIALIVFGPRRLPELGRSLGTAMRDFRRSLNQIQRELEDADPVRNVRDEFRAVGEETRSILGPDRGRDPSRTEGSATSTPSPGSAPQERPVRESDPQEPPPREPDTESG